MRFGREAGNCTSHGKRPTVVRRKAGWLLAAVLATAATACGGGGSHGGAGVPGAMAEWLNFTASHPSRAIPVLGYKPVVLVAASTDLGCGRGTGEVCSLTVRARRGCGLDREFFVENADKIRNAPTPNYARIAARLLTLRIDALTACERGDAVRAAELDRQRMRIVAREVPDWWRDAAVGTATPTIPVTVSTASAP